MTTAVAPMAHPVTAERSTAHLRPLSGGDWSVWRTVCVRGAGFPADTLLNLAAPASARAADEWIDVERRATELRAESKRLRRGARVKTFGGDPIVAARLMEIEQTRDEIAVRAVALRAALAHTFASDASRTSAYLRDVVSEPRFKEAVLWQNRRAVHTAFDSLQRGSPGQVPSRRADKERLVAKYLQRYCAKNDTIGFFGPVAWARFVDDGPAVRIAPGPRLIATRAVHFEGWALDALARTLDARPGLRAWIPPRLLPHVRVDGTRLLIPGRPPVTIAPAHARLLHACDGQWSARRLAHEMAIGPASGLGREGDVYALLDAFAQMGLVIWSLQVPLERDPERTLRARLTEIDDASVRVPCLATLDTLESDRDAVARAAGDVEALDRALATLESTFTALTATSATRSPGETYAGRTLVYEDCRRGAAIEFGPGLLDRVGAPLSLLLESARWCTFEIARWYGTELAAIVSRLTLQAGAPVDLGAVLAEGPDLGGTGQIPLPIANVQAELRRRWMAILAVSPGDRQACYRSADLRGRVRAAFAAPAPGWTWARHVGPDLMIAASSADAIARGDYVLVLGEIHLMNTLLQAALAGGHPDPLELVRALDADCAAPSVVPVHNREVFTERTAISVLPSGAYWYETSRDLAPGPRAKVLRASDLVVESVAGTLWVRTRDGRVRFEAVEFLSYVLALKSATIFGLLPDAPHMPRVTIDEVVVARERWQVSADALSWATAPTALERFAGARRWAHGQGLPRWVFVKVPTERKPCYVDFDSPIYIEMLAKFVRQSGASGAPAGPITITEMLPTSDQLWLVDAEGRRYTSELRLVAVDPRDARRLDSSGEGIAGGAPK